MQIPKTDDFVIRGFSESHAHVSSLHISNLGIEGWPGLLSDAELQRCEAENPWLLDRAPLGTDPYWWGIRTRVPEGQFEIKRNGVWPLGYSYSQQGEMPELAMGYILRSACPDVVGVEMFLKKNSSLYAKLVGRTVEPEFHIEMRDGKQIEFYFWDGDTIPTSTIMYMCSQYPEVNRLLRDSLVAHGQKCQADVEAYRTGLWESAMRDVAPERVVSRASQ